MMNKNRSLVLLFLSCLLLTFCAGRYLRESPQETFPFPVEPRVRADTGRMYTSMLAPLDCYLPESEAKPVILDRAVIYGSLSTNDLAQITGIIGRLCDVNREVSRLEVIWDEDPTPVIVRLGRDELHFLKGRNGKWQVVGCATVISEPRGLAPK